jgi:hypothetical protein
VRPSNEEIVSQISGIIFFLKDKRRMKYYSTSKTKTIKLILLDSLLQEAEHVAPSLLSDSRMTAKMELLP